MFRAALLLLLLSALSAISPAWAAAEKRVYRIDSVIATARNGVVTIEARGAVQSGGWSDPRLKLAHGDAHTLVVEFLARPPASNAAVIEGLLPVIAKTSIKAGPGMVAVRAIGEANEITAQILH